MTHVVNHLGDSINGPTEVTAAISGGTVSSAFETGGRLDPHRICAAALLACSFSVSASVRAGEAGGRLVYGAGGTKRTHHYFGKYQNT